MTTQYGCGGLHLTLIRTFRSSGGSVYELLYCMPECLQVVVEQAGSSLIFTLIGLYVQVVRSFVTLLTCL